jgi:hypothetical protein
MSVVITEAYDFVVNSDKIFGTTGNLAVGELYKPMSFYPGSAVCTLHVFI